MSLASLMGLRKGAEMQALLPTTSATLFSLGWAKVALLQTTGMRMKRRKNMGNYLWDMDIRTLRKLLLFPAN